MSDTINAAKRTWTWVFSILGIIGSAMAVAAGLKRGLNIDLRGTPRIIYEGYAAYRDLVFSFAPFHLPVWAKDALSFYVTAGMALLKAGLDEDDNWRSLLRQFWSVVETVVTWPILLVQFIIDYHYPTKEAREVLPRYFAILLTIFVATACYFFWNHISK